MNKIKGLARTRESRQVVENKQKRVARTRRLSRKQTADLFRASWDKAYDAVEPVVTCGLEQLRLGWVGALGVDEIQYVKGRKCLTLAYPIDLGFTRLLWAGKERTVESCHRFFTTMEQEIVSQIVFVCPDMREHYLNVIPDASGEI